MEKIDLFDLVVKSTPKKGDTVLHYNKEDNPFYINYNTKEEFEKDFELETHPVYQSPMLIPKNIINEYGDTCDAIIQDKKVYLDLNCLYLIVDGKQKLTW